MKTENSEIVLLKQQIAIDACAFTNFYLNIINATLLIQREKETKNVILVPWQTTDIQIGYKNLSINNFKKIQIKNDYLFKNLIWEPRLNNCGFFTKIEITVSNDGNNLNGMTVAQVNQRLDEIRDRLATYYGLSISWSGIVKKSVVA